MSISGSRFGLPRSPRPRLSSKPAGKFALGWPSTLVVLCGVIPGGREKLELIFPGVPSLTGVRSGFGRMGVSAWCASCDDGGGGGGGGGGWAMALAVAMIAFCEPRDREGEARCDGDADARRDGERAAAAKAADEAKPTERGGRPADMREAIEVGRC